MPDHESWRRKQEACERLASDPGATNGERVNASAKAEKFRALLKATGHHGDYEAYVEHGRQAIRSLHGSQWVLGSLASNVQTKYGKRQLQEYADDIGVAHSTLRHYRATWEAWPDVQGRPENFSVAEALNNHPHRYRIVAEFPNLTVRQATEIVTLFHRDDPSARSQRRAAPDDNQQQQQQPQTPPLQPLTLEQAREVYVELALKLAKKERVREAIKLLNLLEVEIS